MKLLRLVILLSVMVLMFAACGPSEVEKGELILELEGLQADVSENKKNLTKAVDEVKALEAELAELKEGGVKVLAKLKTMNPKRHEPDMVDLLKELYLKHPGSDASMEAVAITEKLAPVWKGFVYKAFRKPVK